MFGVKATLPSRIERGIIGQDCRRDWGLGIVNCMDDGGSHGQGGLGLSRGKWLEGKAAAPEAPHCSGSGEAEELRASVRPSSIDIDDFMYGAGVK